MTEISLASSRRSPAWFSTAPTPQCDYPRDVAGLPAIRAAIEAREDLLVTLVEGEGAHFSAGADIAELGDIYPDPAATRDFGDAMQDGLKALMDLDRPTIAVIRGVAIGPGLAWRSPAISVLRRRRASCHHPCDSA